MSWLHSLQVADPVDEALSLRRCESVPGEVEWRRFCRVWGVWEVVSWYRSLQVADPLDEALCLRRGENLRWRVERRRR